MRRTRPDVNNPEYITLIFIHVNFSSQFLTFQILRSSHFRFLGVGLIVKSQFFRNSFVSQCSSFLHTSWWKKEFLNTFFEKMKQLKNFETYFWNQIFNDFHKNCQNPSFFDSILIFLPRSAFLAISSVSSPAPSCSFANSCLRFRNALLYLKFQIKRILKIYTFLNNTIQLCFFFVTYKYDPKFGFRYCNFVLKMLKILTTNSVDHQWRLRKSIPFYSQKL